MKFRLYSSRSGWVSRNSSLESYLGIPDGNGTDRYSEISEVTNPENSDYEKFIMPVETDGRWKCDDQFNPSDLVNFNPDWYPPDED